MDSRPRLQRLAAWHPGLRLLFAYDRSWWRHDLPVELVVTLGRWRGSKPVWSIYSAEV
jgi:hypothetical protein